MMPCQKFLDCLRCTEHVCVKGNLMKLRALRQQLEEGRLLLGASRAGHG